MIQHLWLTCPPLLHQRWFRQAGGVKESRETHSQDIPIVPEAPADLAVKNELLLALGIPTAYLLISTALLLSRHRALPAFLLRLIPAGRSPGT